MKKILFAIAFLVTLAAGAQRSYFIYIQTENNQPFFLKQDDKIIESNASGYLILSKLKDSTYQFEFGFPGKDIPPQRFNVSLNRKDRGYLLKNFGDKWGLFDLQTTSVISPEPMPQSGVQYASVQITDAFSVLLARAADDPKLLYLPVIAETTAKKEREKEKEKEGEKEIVKVKEPESKSSTTSITSTEKKEDAENKIVEIIPPAETPKDTIAVTVTEKSVKEMNIDSVAVQANTDEIKKSVRSDAATEKLKEPEIVIEKVEEKPAAAYAKAIVTRKSESSTTEGFGLVFTDEYDGMVDTVRIIIPHTRVIVNETKKPGETKFLDIDSAPDTIVNTPIVVAVKKSVSKTNCNDFVSDNEISRLRKKMSSAGKDDNMIGEAKKVFRNKCFTTEQIRDLSEMFTTNGGKYYFFDAAYTSVSDPENFSSLESQLKDEYFIKRFKTLLKN